MHQGGRDLVCRLLLDKNNGAQLYDPPSPPIRPCPICLCPAVPWRERPVRALCLEPVLRPGLIPIFGAGVGRPLVNVLLLEVGGGEVISVENAGDLQVVLRDVLVPGTVDALV